MQIIPILDVAGWMFPRDGAGTGSAGMTLEWVGRAGAAALISTRCL